MMGILYLCATPIGNLEDMTFRGIRILSEADYIAAEDTRQTVKLLNHYHIKKPLISYHEHNKAEKGPELINHILNGKTVVLVSDAGMPAISDPGEDLVRLAIEHQIDVIALPGATASLTGLILSGLPTRRFCFEGFLPANNKEKKELLEKLKDETRTIIFYEAPHRLMSTLSDLRENLGNRKISISRELTKKFEETVRGSIEEVMEYFRAKSIKGEFVLVLDGADPKELVAKEQKKWHNISIEEHLQMYLQQGITKKEAIAQVAKERGLNKKEVYKVAIEFEQVSE